MTDFYKQRAASWSLTITRCICNWYTTGDVPLLCPRCGMTFEWLTKQFQDFLADNKIKLGDVTREQAFKFEALVRAQQN